MLVPAAAAYSLPSSAMRRVAKGRQAAGSKFAASDAQQQRLAGGNGEAAERQKYMADESHWVRFQTVMRLTKTQRKSTGYESKAGEDRANG